LAEQLTGIPVARLRETTSDCAAWVAKLQKDDRRRPPAENAVATNVRVRFDADRRPHRQLESLRALSK